jgi:scyllo-inositol 2-dehydrogenase (NADP+)
MIEVGLIGFGLGGRAFHAPVISAVDGLRLAAVLQRRESAAAEIYPDVKVVRSIEELLSIKSIRLVAISTPNDSHYSYAKACLEAGRDVVVDKPFATTFAEAQELADLARRSGRFLTVYQERRLDGDFATVKQLIANGDLGRVVHFEETFDRNRPLIRDSWKERIGPGCGVYWDLAPHLLDHALVLFGEPEALLADIRIERDGGQNADAFDVTFFYGNGLRAVLSSNTLAPVSRPHFSLRGMKASFTKQGLDPQEPLLRAGKPMTGDGWGLETPEEWGTLTPTGTQLGEARKIESARGDYRLFYANVRDSLLGKARPLVTLEEALRVMYALELGEESSKLRKVLPWNMRG